MIPVERMNNFDLWKMAEIFRDEMQKAKDLSYMGMGGLAPATRPQRGYIHGLCDKTGYIETELPYHIKDLYDLTIVEASEVIEILKEESSGYGRRINYNDLPFY